MKHSKNKKRKFRGGRRKHKDAFGFESLEDRKLMATITAGPATGMMSHGVDIVQTQSSSHANQDVAQRIVNGEQTDGYEAVGYVGPLGCTGTLISPTHVLTAAHCLEGVSNTGASFEVNGQTYNSSSVDIHEDYDPNNFSRGDDIAIITLNRPVNGVTPMEINRATPQIGTMLTLVGFGEGGTSTGGYDPSDDGKQVGQTELEGVTAEHITWNFDSHDEANTAPGDSGGPAFITVGGRELIAGVTSGGSGDAHTLGDESFDTRVDVHAAWIDAIVGDAGGGEEGGGEEGGGEEGGGEEGGGEEGGGEEGGGGGEEGSDDHADKPGADATRINLNSAGVGNATGTLETEGDRDAFVFTLTESGETTITLTGTSNKVDTFLRIYNSAGKLIHQNDDFGGTFDSQVKVDLAAGKYFATAGSYADGDTGNYRININHKADPSGESGSGSGVFSNDRTFPISAQGQDRVVSSINVSGLNGTVTDVNVRLDIDHSYTSDLRLILVAPDNTRIVLANRVGDDGNNFDRTVFDQQANQSIRQGDAPFRGTFKAQHNLNRLNGVDPNGRWRLIVHDFEDLDGGRLNFWSIELTTDQANGRGRIAGGADAIGWAPGQGETTTTTTTFQSDDAETHREVPDPAGSAWGLAFMNNSVMDWRNISSFEMFSAYNGHDSDQADEDLTSNPMDRAFEAFAGNDFSGWF